MPALRRCAGRLELRLPALISQGPGTPGFAGIVIGVPYAVHDRHLGEVEWADAFETRDIDAVLLRIRAALVMGVDAALRTEEMLGLAGIEPVAGQLVLAPDDMQAAQGRGHRDRAAHSAIGTGASPDGVEAVAELNLELDRATMTLTAHIFLSFQTNDNILPDQGGARRPAISKKRSMSRR